jgi:hypothetical protein
MVDATVVIDPPLTADNPETSLAKFLKEHEEVEMIAPVILGLFVTSRLQLRGANALLVNLGIATVFRQLFRQLKETTFPPSFSAPQQQQEQTVKTLDDGVAIVHSVPGRIRLRIEQVVKDELFAKRLERLLLQDNHVLKVRINRAAASVAIAYDQGDLTDLDLGFRLMTILQEARSGVTH